MKIFFWLLVVANVIFFAVMKSGMLDDGQGEQTPLPVNAEQITLLNAPVAAALPVSAPISAPAAEGACFEWGGFSGTDIDLVTKALKKLNLGDRLSQHDIDRPLGYWVYIPPVNSKAAVAQKVAQLKALGVTDYFVVQDAGEWLNSISLGVFKTREAAQSFLDGLREKGIHSARVGEKSSKNPVVMFVMNGLDKEMSDKLNTLQKDFSDSELKRVSCH